MRGVEAGGEEQSRQVPMAAGEGGHYLAKTVLRGGAVLQAVYGRLRSPFSLDIVFGKETSIELLVIEEDGTFQSVCEQNVFGIIKDLSILRGNQKLRVSAQQTQGKDLLVVLSDSGNLTFLAFCSEMHRFFPVRHVQLSKPGNSRNQLGRMLAVESNGCFIAASAYNDRFAVFSVSESAGSNIIDKIIFYPSENEGEASSGWGPSRINVHVTIWSMSFISKESKKVTEDEHSCILAMVIHRQDASLNDLLLFSCNSRENTIRTISQYSEPGPLAISITEVPHLSGFAFLSREGDILLMDLRDPSNPCCIQKISVSTGIVEDHSSADESCRGIDADDEGMSKVAACALLELRDSGDDMVRRNDPMSIDRRDNGTNSTIKYVTSWSWEPSVSSPKLIMCLNTGELFVLEVNYALGGMRVNMCNSMYRILSCNVLLWLESGLIAAFVEMGDGMIFKWEDGELLPKGRIQNLSPILDLCFVDYHGEKQDQMYACCGMRSEGSLRIVLSGIIVDRLYRSVPIYKGITGTWTLRMKESDSHHSFLVVSFVEQTRVLSVGLSFVDASDAIGFQTDVCTLACGLLADGLLVQIHRTAVRLCLPTTAAHPEGIPLPQPVSTSWYPGNMTISVGAVGHNFIVIATSNPCFLFILGFRSFSVHQYEMYEIQHVRLHYEVSCISIPHQKFRQGFSGSTIGLADKNHMISVPSGVENTSTFVVGTHKPSVELLSFSPDEGCKVLAVGSILLNNTFGAPLSGCIPEDVKIVLVDRFYVLAGLRNGMLLRFEWPTDFSVVQSGAPKQSSFISLSKQEISLANATSSCTVGPQYTSMTMMGEVNNSVPLLQLIALRRIGITPVFLVPLHDSLDADIIALSDRPWLLQTARHSLAYTSISFQCATHVTPVSTVHCPKGVLFVAENSLHLVEMVHSKRLNVQKFSLRGTPRKVLYHNESKTLLVMMSGIDDSCSSEICRIDPNNGLLLSSFNCERGEVAKCMEIVKVGNEQVLVVGTSQTTGKTIMPSGESESAKGRLIVISLEKMPTPDDSSLAIGSNIVSSQTASPFHESIGYAAEQLSSSSLCSSPDDNSYDGFEFDKMEVGQLRAMASLSMPGVVLSICSYLDRFVLASAGSSLYINAFQNDNPHRLRRLTSAKTRFTITCLTTHFTRIVVGDCRDGILFYTYKEDLKKLEQVYCDPVQRLVADCALIDMGTAVVSDWRGNISILSSPNDLEDGASPECNLRVRCSYYTGEIIMSIRKGSFSYKLPADDVLKPLDSDETIPHFAKNSIVAGTFLGNVMTFVPITSEEHELLKTVQARLVVHPWTAPILGNDHTEFRGRGSPFWVSTILDGDMLAQFLELTSMQQAAVLAAPFNLPGLMASTSKPADISTDQVVQLLEQVHYALN